MNPQEFLDRFSPPCFFHFTDSRNIDSIRKHGLLSLAEIHRRSIEVVAFGGNSWSHQEDKRRGLDKYVHLCFKNEHPMEYVARVEQKRIKDSWFIPIAKEILFIEGIKFSSQIANKSGSRLLTIEEACEEMDFQVIYQRNNWNDPEIQKRFSVAKKYELLVPSSIAVDHLTL
jgi:hypothetical protein